MAHSRTLEAIVLKAHDVGEADRYVILFTKEKGRVAVRARGVRKLKSRIGGSLLPFNHILAEVKETDAGFLVAGASPMPGQSMAGLEAFVDASQGFELLLRLIQDDEPLLEVFSASVAFLQACRERVPHAPLAYGFRLLHLLGFLPSHEGVLSHAREGIRTLDEAQASFLRLAREGYFLRIPHMRDIARLERVRDQYLNDQLTGPLKSGKVAASIRY